MNLSTQELFTLNENHKFAAKLLSQYRVLQLLGQGAFSSVFKVFHDGEFFAIKVMGNKNNLDRL